MESWGLGMELSEKGTDELSYTASVLLLGLLLAKENGFLDLVHQHVGFGGQGPLFCLNLSQC